MSIKGKAFIAGIYEHPTRKAEGIPLVQLHAEVAKGALHIHRPDAVTSSDSEFKKGYL